MTFSNPRSEAISAPHLLTPTPPPGTRPGAIRRRLPLLFVVGLALTALAGPAAAIRMRSTRPIQIRTVGYIGATHDPLPEVTLVLSHPGGPTRFNVTKLRILTGDVSPANVITALQPYKYRLQLRGPDELRRKLSAAEPSDQVEIIGFIRIAERLLMASAINVSKPAPSADPDTADH